MKIKMTRTAVGQIDGETVHYIEGRTYEGVNARIAQKLHAAGACEWAGDSFPKLEKLQAEQAVEEAAAEPVAELAENPKPRKRRTRKRST